MQIMIMTPRNASVIVQHKLSTLAAVYVVNVHPGKLSTQILRLARYFAIIAKVLLKASYKH